MFHGKRFVARGIADTISVEVQIFLWSLIDDLIAKRVVGVDYLQVFEFVGEYGKQKIVHSQEIPYYRAAYQFDNVVSPLNCTVYVIDNSNYVTMLLCREY